MNNLLDESITRYLNFEITFLIAKNTGRQTLIGVFMTRQFLELSLIQLHLHVHLSVSVHAGHPKLFRLNPAFFGEGVHQGVHIH